MEEKVEEEVYTMGGSKQQAGMNLSKAGMPLLFIHLTYIAFLTNNIVCVIISETSD